MFMICKPSGTRFSLVAPTPDMVNIRDIARHLSNKCRWSGAVEQYFSVAQHSVFVSRMIEPANAFLGLMHDAEEAYTGDISTPMKDVLVDARAVGDRFRAVIGLRFSLPPKELWPKSVKHFDAVALATEWRDVVVPPEGAPDYWEPPTVEPWPDPLVGVPPKVAERMFLERFHELYKGE